MNKKEKKYVYLGKFREIRGMCRILGCGLRYYFGANPRYTLTKCIFFTKVFQRSAPQYDLF